MTEENGLAVIGVFLKVRTSQAWLRQHELCMIWICVVLLVQVGKRHEGLQKLVDALPAIRHKVSMGTHPRARWNFLINCTYSKEK